MGVTDFWDKTPRQIFIETNAKLKLFEREERDKLEQTRFVMWASMVGPHMKMKSDFKLTDVLKFSWDEVEESPFTNEEARAVMSKWESTDGLPITN